ncbi:BlaI/MecI/CopY family transcriptional regulator [Glaciecola siphonariae]|uniref:BlaI/MecI/CopY family transcriptional regulator n=1 Tax=Glaciecola siphonariae TaxID=521012 RepID=A0ABV9LUY6_9ALTE
MNISKTEFEVMDVIWQLEPCASSDVVARLSKTGNWHEKTVKTLINRLLTKGALRHKKEGRKYTYESAISREEYQQKHSKDLISKVFKGKLSSLVSSFANEEALSQEDVDALKTIIRQWEQDND